MQPLSIRPATPADIPLLLTLIRELAAYEQLLHKVEVTEARLDAALFGPRPAAEAILAEAAGIPAGYALVFSTFSSFVGNPGLWLEDIYVRPAHRNQGIGRALFLHVVGLARARGCGRLEWSALDWNEPALRFYQAQGAQLLADWKMLRLDEAALAKLTRG